MRYVICMLLLFISLGNSGCVSKKVAEQTASQRDSLITVVADKDSLINAVFSDINAISENLAAIKSRENLITVATSQEGVSRPVEEINDNIAAIDRLLQENREKIQSLEQTAARLHRANIRIGALEKTIANLQTQLKEKSDEVTRLRSDLQRKEAEVAQLTEQVAAGQERENRQSAEIDRLTDEKEQWANQSNRVYYIVDSEENLRNAQIINKQGFIGRTTTVNGNTPLESFSQADIRLLEEIPINRKRITLVTTHPDGSYQLIADADKRIVKLVISDPERFWESSRILVISYRK